MTGDLVAVGLGAYLIGSIPSGYLVGLLHRIDVRQQGSGNIGATNVARSVGASAGLATLAVDMVKGAAPVVLVGGLEHLSNADPDGQLRARVVAAVGSVVGHIFSIFLRFRGGKGVATTLGALVALAPAASLGPIAVFAAVFATWRIVSLASIVAALTAPLTTLALGYPGLVTAAIALLAALIVGRHTENIVRLRNGTEARFRSGQKS